MHIRATVAHAPTTSLAMLDRIIGHAGGGDLLPGAFGSVEDDGGHGGGILNQLLGVLTTDAMDGMLLPLGSLN
jgi:hypothetical protein